MKNTKAFLKEFYTQELKTTHGAKGDTIHQTQRNAVKAGLMLAIEADINAELGIDALRTADGVAVLMDNDIQGGVPFVLDIAMKSFDYDIYSLNEAYIDDKALKAANAEKRAQTKAIKYKNDTNARKLRETK